MIAISDFEDIYHLHGMILFLTVEGFMLSFVVWSYFITISTGLVYTLYAVLDWSLIYLRVIIRF
jgi:hypothetical protein